MAQVKSPTGKCVCSLCSLGILGNVIFCTSGWCFSVYKTFYHPQSHSSFPLICEVGRTVVTLCPFLQIKKLRLRELKGLALGCKSPIHRTSFTNHKLSAFSLSPHLTARSVPRFEIRMQLFFLHDTCEEIELKFSLSTLSPWWSFGFKYVQMHLHLQHGLLNSSLIYPTDYLESPLGLLGDILNLGGSKLKSWYFPNPCSDRPFFQLLWSKALESPLESLLLYLMSELSAKYILQSNHFVPSHSYQPGPSGSHLSPASLQSPLCSYWFFTFPLYTLFLPEAALSHVSHSIALLFSKSSHGPPTHSE